MSLMSCSSDVDLASCQSPSGDSDTLVILGFSITSFIRRRYHIRIIDLHLF